MSKTHTDVATVLANRFMVQVGDRVRITYGEAHDDGDHYHQAVSLSRDDALELASVIYRILTPNAGEVPTPESPLAAAPEPIPQHA